MIMGRVPMADIYEFLEERKKKLEKYVIRAEKGLVDAPNERLTVRKSGRGRNTYQYYIRDEKNKKTGRYLSKKDVAIAEKIAQVEYCKEFLVRAELEIKAIDRLLKVLRVSGTENILEFFPEGKRILLHPFEMTDKMYVERWLAMDYERKGFLAEKSEYYTDKNERVRSKTEILIANTLNKYDVPYHYEKPVKLSGEFIVHPDFTVLNVRKQHTFYWEHFGMMGDAEYCNNALAKIKKYQRNGIFPGRDLIMTFESADQPISTLEIEDIIKNYLLR